jgi:hypothetical protein
MHSVSISSIVARREEAMPNIAHIPRAYDRFETDLEIRVSVFDGDRPVSSEAAVLKNLSGKGLCFFSHQPAKYPIGERVSVDIELDNTGDVTVSGMGTVVWVGADTDVGERTSIGISMDDLLSFDRFMHLEG